MTPPEYLSIDTAPSSAEAKAALAKMPPTSVVVGRRDGKPLTAIVRADGKFRGVNAVEIVDLTPLASTEPTPAPPPKPSHLGWVAAATVLVGSVCFYASRPPTVDPIGVAITDLSRRVGSLEKAPAVAPPDPRVEQQIIDVAARIGHAEDRITILEGGKPVTPPAPQPPVVASQWKCTVIGNLTGSSYTSQLLDAFSKAGVPFQLQSVSAANRPASWWGTYKPPVAVWTDGTQETKQQLSGDATDPVEMLKFLNGITQK